jgi:hypothetical protein
MALGAYVAGINLAGFAAFWYDKVRVKYAHFDLVRVAPSA